MTPVKDRHARLAESLFRKTLSKEIDWFIDEWAQNKLTTKLSGYKITIEREENFENEPIVVIYLRKDDGDIIDSFSDTDLSGMTPKLKGFTSYWQVMDQLQRSAFRQAVGADEALDKIITELDDDVPF